MGIRLHRRICTLRGFFSMCALFLFAEGEMEQKQHSYCGGGVAPRITSPFFFSSSPPPIAQGKEGRKMGEGTVRYRTLVRPATIRDPPNQDATARPFLEGGQPPSQIWAQRQKKKKKKGNNFLFRPFSVPCPFSSAIFCKKEKSSSFPPSKKSLAPKKGRKKEAISFFPLCPNLMMMELSCNFCVPTELSSLFLRENAVSKEGSHVTSYERFCSSPSQKFSGVK